MKTSYHPSIVVAFYLDCLPHELVQCLPRSTRYDWKHKNLPSQFGYDWFCRNQQLFCTLQQISTHNKLLLFNRALLRIIAIKKFITTYAAWAKDHLFQVPQTIIANISKVVPFLGLLKTLRFLQLPYTSFLKLKQPARCIASPFNL